jgi:hypothetical protein
VRRAVETDAKRDEKEIRKKGGKEIKARRI